MMEIKREMSSISIKSSVKDSNQEEQFQSIQILFPATEKKSIEQIKKLETFLVNYHRKNKSGISLIWRRGRSFSSRAKAGEKIWMNLVVYYDKYI